MFVVRYQSLKSDLGPNQFLLQMTSDKEKSHRHSSTGAPILTSSLAP